MFRSYAATSISKIAYGKNTPTSATDPDVIEVLQQMKVVMAVLRPGTYLVESIPWLRYLPFYGLELKRAFESGKQLTSRKLNRVKRDIVHIALAIFT